MCSWIKSETDCTEEQRLSFLAAEQLRQSPYRELHRVSCTAQGRVLVLTGSVSSFYYKQQAQAQLRRSLATDVSLDNRLEVVSSTC